MFALIVVAVITITAVTNAAAVVVKQMT